MEWFIFALGAAVLTSLVSVLEKKLLFKEHATEYSATVALVNFLVTLPFFYFVDFKLTPFLWLLMFLGAFFASLGFLFVAKAVRHMELSTVSPMLNFSPLFTAILATLALGERISWVNVVGILILILGAYILEIDFNSHGLLSPFKNFLKSRHMYYIFFALGSYSLSAVIGKIILNYTTPLTLIFIQQGIVFLIFLLILQVKYDGIRGIKHGIKTVGKWLIVIGILTVSYRFLQATAISMTFVSLVIPIKRLSTLFSTILGGKLFNEHGLYHKVIACIIMIAGASMIILG